MDVPKLDDVTFAQLVEEAKKRIPQYNTEWTDYNIHDPGIMLIELFAWLSEMQIFFLDQLTEKDRRKYLKLLGSPLQKGTDLNQAIFDAKKDLKKPYRAVTLEDYEFLAKETPEVNIARAHAFWNTDRVQVIVGVKRENLNTLRNATEDEKTHVCNHIDTGRLLTTLVEIIDPTIVLINVQADIRTKPLASQDAVTTKIGEALEKFLNPLIGGWDEKGWPFGRSVYKSEIIALIEDVDGVDCIQSLTLSIEVDAGGSKVENGNIILSKHALTDSGSHHQINIVGSQMPCRRSTV